MPPSRKSAEATPPIASVEKPPYAIPPMAEIAKLRGSSGLRAVSTFSGCGGSCLGLEWAGFDVLWASEFIPAARDVYERNHPGVILDPRDIREVSAADILEATGLKKGELDLFEGSPPCASFSTAGKRQKGWGEVKPYSDTKQRTDDLFFEWARLLDGLEPRAFIAENVTGLVKGAAYGYFLEILERLRVAGPGYRVTAFNVDASWLGVPQKRQRIFFVGVRSDLEKDPVCADPLPYQYSIADAIPWIASYSAKGHGFFDGADGAGYYKHEVERTVPDEALLEGTAIGREYPKIPPGKWGKKYKQLGRPRVGDPSPTITQTAGQRGAAGVCHPTEPRKFTIPELRRLCGFPDDFVLTGTYKQQWERLARSVPPPMMRAMAAKIRDLVL